MKSLLCLLVLAVSCASKPVEEFPWTSNAELWTGRSVDDLITHTVFAVMPMQERKSTTGTKVYTFTAAGTVTSTADCFNTMGGGRECRSESFQAKCYHIFVIKNEMVSAYERRGNCGVERAEFRPVTEEGLPVVSAREKEYIDRKLANEPKYECMVNADCRDGMSCDKEYEAKKGFCKTLNAFERMFTE